MHSQAESQLRERYSQTLELEVRKYRRKALLSRHNLEQDLLREVSMTYTVFCWIPASTNTEKFEKNVVSLYQS